MGYSYNPKSLCADEFINDEEIQETLAYADAHKNDLQLCYDILEKCKPHLHPANEHGAMITHREASVLLACENKGVNDAIKKLAHDIKQAYYGNRIVLFAPLYLSNYCVNGCLYCPYHAKNREIPRRKLTQDIKHKNGAIRRVNVNIAATTVEEYRMLKEAEIGTYILFQETYNKEGYKKLHPTGPKSDYNWHTEAMDRAMEGGIDDVGLGVLFGLESYRYEFAGLIMHAEHLEAVHGVGPHTISVPRVKPAMDIDPDVFDNGIPDEMFEKIIALIRITVPYTGMIISTREGQTVREHALQYGISQISGGSRTSVGGYTETARPHDTEQFDVSDQRTLDEVISWLIDQQHVPSFCTACYRAGRTGDRFMSFCKNGQILNYCHPNALITLAEYLVDYATPETFQKGFELLEREMYKIKDDNRRHQCVEAIYAIVHEGKRDQRF